VPDPNTRVFLAATEGVLHVLCSTRAWAMLALLPWTR